MVNVRDYFKNVIQDIYLMIHHNMLFKQNELNHHEVSAPRSSAAAAAATHSSLMTQSYADDSFISTSFGGKSIIDEEESTQSDDLSPFAWYWVQGYPLYINDIINT